MRAASRFFLAGLGFGLALAGCVNTTPLPLSPLQVILGGWPLKEEVARTVPRAYTIKGDTFAFPASGFSITRPSEKDWEFQATGNGVGILLKQGVAGSEPRPAMTIALIPVPEGTDVAEALLADQATVFQGGGGVATSQIGVDGIQGESWIVTSKDPESQLLVRTWRVYIVHEGTITLAQGRAEPNAFIQLLPLYESMLTTMRVPKSPNAPAEGETAVKRVDLVRFTDVVMRNNNLAIKGVDPEVWLVSNTNGATTTFERRDLPSGAQGRPVMSLTVGPIAAGTDVAKLLADERAAIEAAGTKVTVGTGTIGGKTGETWDYTERPGNVAVGVTRHRITSTADGQLAQAEYSADEKTFPTVKAEFEALIAGITLPPTAPAAATPAQ